MKTYENALLPGAQLNEYSIIKVLGAGGFGITYLAQDTHLEKHVVIKEYFPDTLANRHDQSRVTAKTVVNNNKVDFQWGLDQFLKEARTLAKFDHPNIVRILRFFEENGTGYFVMDHLEGETLSELMKRKSSFQQNEVLDVAIPILKGLSPVHQAGLLHRDIKPENIYLRQSGEPLLIDFGAARVSLGDHSKSVTILTPGYAPAEQYDSKNEQDPRTDIYALGAVMYELTTGFQIVDAWQRMTAIVNDKSDPLKSATMRSEGAFSSDFLATIDEMLAVRQKDRISDVTELLQRFEQTRQYEPGASPSQAGTDNNNQTTIKTSTARFNALYEGFRIGSFNVLPLKGRIIGPAGEIKLQPKVIDVLVYMASTPGELVTRSDLYRQIWGSVIVTENALQNCIAELRTALGPEEHIEVIGEQGYRLITEVGSLNTIARSIQATRIAPNRPPAIESAIATVAVLPFENLTPTTPHAFLADAIPISLHSSLSRLNRIRVVSRRSSFALRDSTASSAELGKQLDVRYIVSGSVAEAGNRIRVIAEVDDAEADVLLWSQRYEVQDKDVLDFEQELTQAVVGAFGGQRLRAEISRAQEAPASELDAWGLVQKARAYLVDYKPETLREARALLEEAIAKDPDYAFGAAMYALLIAENLINVLSENIQADTAAAKQAADKALQLAPNDPAILRTCGCALAYCGDYRNSLTTLRKAVETAPFDLGAWGYLGWPLTATGKDEDFQEIIEITERLLDNAPSHPGLPYWNYHRSVALECTGEAGKALEAIETCLKTQPGFALGQMHYASVLGQLDRYDDAAIAAADANKANAMLTPQSYREMLEHLSDQTGVHELRLAGLRKAGLLTD
jgi:serine/threonine protein kinase/tetratricopeptide (TPR) repeat protein